MATGEERYAALHWAATLRGASSSEDALDWVAARGLGEWGDDGSFALTAEGEKRADELHQALARAGGVQRKRGRATLALLALAGVIVWRRRSRIVP